MANKFQWNLNRYTKYVFKKKIEDAVFKELRTQIWFIEQKMYQEGFKHV